MLRDRIKWLLFPGINLHARLRGRVLPAYFGTAGAGEVREVLDAGCGNGMLAYQSCLRGNRVLGVSIKAGEIERNKRLFNQLLGIPEDRLSFSAQNIYELDGLGSQVDEIICTEVLEHLERDAEVCRVFRDVLKEGGVLHLCCPNADHPDNARHELDASESGGHVRPGYTLESYRALLEPLGFRITECVGLGGPVRQAFNRRIIRAQERFGLVAGCALFVLALPFLWLDRKEPKVPYSLYVRAVRVPERDR